MTATAMHSRLNPFADAFIPSSQSNSYGVESLLSTTCENKMEAILQISCVKDESTANKTPETDIKDSKTGVEFSVVETSSWNEIVDKSATSLLDAYFSPSDLAISQSVNKSKLSVSEILSCSVDHEEIDQKGTADLEGAFDGKEKESQCRCPPMFGWVIPLNFLGNPFNTKYDCHKKYAHIPSSAKEVETDKLTLDDTDLQDLTLDQCVLEYKNILVDVYETVLNFDPISKWDEKYKIRDYLEISDNETDRECRYPSWSQSILETSESELVDDGCHPLLQEAVITNTNEDEKEIESIEKILGSSLMPSTSRSLNSVAVNTEICNPPCSVWCDFLPSAAKDTFKKYLKKYGLTKKAMVAGRGRVSVGSKPIYKRSLSADDASSYAQHMRCFQTSTAESKETLLLLTKDPAAYFRNACNAVNGGATQSKSCSNLDSQSSAKPNVDSHMWGPFDGADSLWQPLPDCVQTNEANLKHSCYKKGREMRRQRSIN